MYVNIGGFFEREKEREIEKERKREKERVRERERESGASVLNEKSWIHFD